MIDRSKITPETCRQHGDKVFVFGDNLIHKGKAGQACIRDEPNSFGIPTKRLPSMSDNAFFSDKDEEFDIILTCLRELYRLSKTTEIVFPLEIGTGLSKMPDKSPKLYRKMIQILREHFGYKEV
jgi:hypothetical protein